MKVGDYVRTKDGRIYKIGDIGNFIYSEDNVIIQGIIKSSPNIIDLIEVGDYVNGVEVENIDDEWITMSDTKVPILKSIANGMIKSVITHEQMEQMAYKVGE